MIQKRPIGHLAGVIAEAAKAYNVVPEIHEDDFIFQYSLSRNPNVKAVAKRYFDRGNYASSKLLDYMKRFSFGEKALSSVLDFASGYGCVARHFHRHLEKSCRIVCCDIHDKAVVFIREKLQLEAIQSSIKPQDLEVRESFDVIFALSFFSHMPDSTWGRWLARLAELLNAGGFILFTTHGYESLRRAHYPVDKFDGFRFNPSSEQNDLNPAEYGSTIVSLNYTIRQLPSNCRLVHFSEAEWEGYQDVYILSKNP
jgi:cyclopropane fatty-acyl-phospholipid synthase-like methyltransferase